MGKMTGWQKGCVVTGLGCVGVIVLTVTVAGIALVWAASSARRLGDPTPEPVSRTIARSDRSGRDGDLRGQRRQNDPQNLEARGDDASLVVANEQADGDVLHLRIDMQEGRFEVRPGPPGSDLKVDGTYAAAYYDLTEERDEGRDGASALTIRFRSNRSLPVRLFAGLMGGRRNPNRLTVSIPEDLLVELDLRLGRGASEVDLGGLRLTALDVEMSMGDHELEFSRPLATEVREGRLDGRMGDITFNDLGNARARELDITTSMGETTVDLSGDWPDRAEVSVRHSMGELRVDVPNDVRLAESSRLRIGTESRRLDRRRETDDSGAPEIELRVNASMGDARVRRY